MSHLAIHQDYALEPDVIASNLDERYQTDRPERRLWLATLVDALRDSVRGDEQGRRARRWFHSASDDVGSFHFICDVLGLTWTPTAGASVLASGLQFHRTRMTGGGCVKVVVVGNRFAQPSSHRVVGRSG